VIEQARAAFAAGDPEAACAAIVRVADSAEPYRAWAAAATLLGRVEAAHGPAPARRSVRVALAGSYTTAQLGALLRVAALRRGVRIELHETGYDVFAQEMLDPASALHAFAPDYVVLAPHDGAIGFPALSEDPEAALEAEVTRWRALWDAAGARVIQHTIAIRPDTAWGHAGLRVPGSRDALLRALNARLAQAAGDDVLLVDAERVASAFGTARWFDDRYWHRSKQAVALDALPELARHTAAVLAGAEGLSAKCVVLDLDGTLWGGVVADEGLAGIALGGGPRGDAHVAFQEYLLALRARGIVLAVASKNDDAVAREPFERHPDMRLRLSDIAAFAANWEPKPANVEALARTLGLGLEAIVFVDDNPAEREAVRRALPQVEVPELPADPAGYVRALSDTLLFEAATVTGDDLRRAESYRARAVAAQERERAGSLDAFLAGLEMEAVIEPFDELNLARVAQLVAKTNQFNLTTRRHPPEAIRTFMEDDECVTLYLRLRDHLADHGLVGVLIARRDGDALAVDTWLLSCRVIGRTAEDAMLRRLCELALERGCATVRGTYVPTARNAVVAGLYERLGFAPAGRDGDATVWTYDITEKGVPADEHVRRVALAHA
jgi:FkbH-like protein